MSSRPRLTTTTLAGPSRLVLAAATGGLVALASAGTALLVLTGTSAVTPTQSVVPPLPARGPLAHAPGVVIVPTPAATARRTHSGRRVQPHLFTAPAGFGPVVPQALAFVPATSAQLPEISPQLPAAPGVPSIGIELRLRGRALAAVRRAPIAETVARGAWPAPVGPASSTVRTVALSTRDAAQREHGHRRWHRADAAVRHGRHGHRHHRHRARHRHA